MHLHHKYLFRMLVEQSQIQTLDILCKWYLSKYIHKVAPLLGHGYSNIKKSQEMIYSLNVYHRACNLLSQELLILGSFQYPTEYLYSYVEFIILSFWALILDEGLRFEFVIYIASEWLHTLLTNWIIVLLKKNKNICISPMPY